MTAKHMNPNQPNPTGANLMNSHPTLAGILVAIALSSMTLTAFGATTEPVDIDDRLAAKIAKMKVKNRANGQNNNGYTSSPGGQIGYVGDGQQTECGAVDIGNVNTNGRGGGPREVTVVITGDVVNTGNKCK